MSEEAEKRMSKYAAKKARQAKTGEVGYIVGEIKITTEPNKVRQSAAERRLQSERDRAAYEAAHARETAAIKTEIAFNVRLFIEHMETATKSLGEAASAIALAGGHAFGCYKGDIVSVTGLYGVANEKAQSALLRARMLLAQVEGAKTK